MQDDHRLALLHQTLAQQEGGGGDGDYDDERQPAPLAQLPFQAFAELEPLFAQIHRTQLRDPDSAHLQDAWVCFNKLAPSRRSKWRTRLRRLQGFRAGVFTHVELMFRDSHGLCVAYTVDEHDPAVLGSGYVRSYIVDPSRDYPAVYWSLFKIQGMSAAQLHGMNFYCERQKGKPFNWWGRWLNFLPLINMFAGRARDEEPHYFCSQLVASALRFIWPDRFRHLNPRLCTPESLLREFAHHKHVFLERPVFLDNATATTSPPAGLTLASAAAAAAAAPIGIGPAAAVDPIVAAAQLTTIGDQSWRPFNMNQLRF